MNTLTATTPAGELALDWLALTEVRDVAHERYAQRLHASVPRVVRRVGAFGGEETAALLESWRDVLLALPAQAALDAVSHPLFNYYWLQLLDGCVNADRDFLRRWAHHLGRFLLVPALRHGIAPPPLEIPAGQGELRLPGYRTHLVFAEHDRPVRVHIDAAGDAVVRDGSVRIAPGFLLEAEGADTASVVRVTRNVVPGTSIEMDAGDPWISRLMASMNTKPAKPGYPAPDLRPMTEIGQAQCRDVGLAFDLIERVWPQLAAEIRAYVSLFVPYRSAYHSSFTEACMMGTVFLSEAMWPFSDVAYTAEHFLHEEAHLRLTLIEELDPLLTPAREATYDSPWRRDPRPLSGMVQAAFAFARIAAFHRKAYEETGESVHDRRHAETVILLARGINEVESGPRLDFTPAGERLWSQMREEAKR